MVCSCLENLSRAPELRICARLDKAFGWFDANDTTLDYVMAKHSRSLRSKPNLLNDTGDHQNSTLEPDILSILNDEDPNLLTKELQKSFGKILRKTRIHLHLTQTELGELAGMGTQYVSKVELEKKNFTLRTMRKLALVMEHDIVISFKKVNLSKK